MNKKNKIRKICNLAFGLVGGLFLVPTQTEASTLSPTEAQAYLDIVNGYQQQYGTGQADTNQNGLLQSRLLDMDGDGDFELQVFYVASGMPTLELWHFADSVAEKFFTEHLSEDLPFMYGGSVAFELYEYQNQVYLYFSGTGGRDGSAWWVDTVYAYQNKTMEVVSSLDLGWRYDEFWNGEFYGTIEGVSVLTKEADGYPYADWQESFQKSYGSGKKYNIGSYSGGEMTSYTYQSMPITSCVSELQTLASAPPVVVEESQESQETTETSPQNMIFSQHNTYTAPTQGDIAQSYLDVLAQITSQYGTSDGQSVGLVSSHLLDIDGDGQEELFVSYCTTAGSGYNGVIVLEVWEFAGNSAMRTFCESYQKGYQIPSKSWDADWRDVGHLYPYGNTWVLYLAGGGGSDRYESYDEVYTYQRHNYLMTVSDNMRKNNSGDSTYFSGQINNSYYSGQGTSVASAIPDWYAEFKAIQDKYLSGNGVELFYMDKSGVSWTKNSCESVLQERVGSATPNIEEVVIPSKDSDGTYLLASAYQEVIDNIRIEYGTSSGKSLGLAQNLLGDFTGDGIPELFVTYVSFVNANPADKYLSTTYKLHLELWEFQGDTAVKIFQEEYELSQQVHDHGSTLSLLEKDGLWLLYEQFNGGDAGGDSVLSYRDGGFHEIASSYMDSALTNYLNGTYYTDHDIFGAAVDAYYEEYNISESIGVYQRDIGIGWDTLNYLPTLANLLAIPEASHHYFGYPVVFDEEIHISIINLPINGELLAVYQVDEGLFYGIVSVNGVQESRLISNKNGNWEILHSATENLSYQDLEEEKNTYLNLSSGGTSVSSSPNSTSSDGENNDNMIFMGVWLGLIVVLSTGLVVTLKQMKKNGKP